MRIVVVGVMAGSILSFRGEMLRAMADAGHTVLALAPEEDEEVGAALADMGVTYRSAPILRTGLNPIRDAATVKSLAGTFRAFKADMVLCYAAKPVVYGTLAARIAGVPVRAAMITGVGSALGGGTGIRGSALGSLLRTLYRVALREAQIVFFQNPDDEQLFRSLKLVGGRNRVVRINGSGVDLDFFRPAPLPARPVTFLQIGRLIRDKGVREFVQAAGLVRAQRPDARFQILGRLDTNPTAIRASEVESWGNGAVDYLGETHDVRPYLAAAHVCVLASYGEGTPRSVLEAMAMARPILTTDVPGCRQTIEQGRNGFMVPVRDAAALAEAMLEMLAHPERLESMGRESRRLAEERFDVHSVNRVILEAMGLNR
jgi:glycosyltransferase involved in cell wall biosynthesis